MGEYADYNGREVKIGTCESMYYLRADQIHDVTAVRGNVDPVKDRLEIRFRFPFPDEDTTAPGEFEDFERVVNVPGFELGPEYTGHGSIQLTSNHPKGWVTSVPCPLGPEKIEGVTVHRNGGWDGVGIYAQKFQEDGSLWTVVRCAACSRMWRLPLADAERLVVALRSAADRQVFGREMVDYFYGDERRAFMHEVTSRVLAGYSLTVSA